MDEFNTFYKLIVNPFNISEIKDICYYNGFHLNGETCSIIQISYLNNVRDINSGELKFIDDDVYGKCVEYKTTINEKQYSILLDKNNDFHYIYNGVVIDNLIEILNEIHESIDYHIKNNIDKTQAYNYVLPLDEYVFNVDHSEQKSDDKKRKNKLDTKPIVLKKKVLSG